MPAFRTGVVTELLSRRSGFQRVVVDDRPAYVLTDLVGQVGIGDRVVVNTTALDRRLGTGGSDVVHWNLSNDTLDLPGRGHVMAARYTSVQHDAGTWDTDEGPGAATAPHDTAALAASVPTIGCMLHSHAMALCAALSAQGLSVGYVMNEAGALALALSDLLAASVEAGSVMVTASVGQAFGGEIEAVTVPSAVAGCAHSGAEIVVVGAGPGHVGTGDPLAFSGLSLAGDLDLLSLVGSPTALALRWSSRDQRERHKGISHHSVTLLEVLARSHAVPVPDAEMASAVADVLSGAGSDSQSRPVVIDPVDVVDACGRFGLDIDTMGRSLADDAAALKVIGSTAAWGIGLSPDSRGSTGTL
ncbi:MAG: DUF3866 family protein [Actinomycetia bacterium]|nr:DUF3866 family protein [Actinomycetes bacterium]MCP4959321.1 DUF3866 family protein [Actinomycetes bacterium]